MSDTSQEAAKGWRDKINDRLIDDWQTQIKTLWSVRVAMFWLLVSSILTVWSATVDVLPLWAFTSIGIVMNLSLGIARLLKQPGASDGD